MKRNLLWFFGLAIMAATTFTMTSCEDDPCKDVKCGDNGECFDGACVCNVGFEGTNCDVAWADKFAGTWAAVETSTGTSGPLTNSYNVIISKVSENKIKLVNLGAFGGDQSVEFELTAADKVSMVGTNVPEGQKFTGTATFADGKITVTYVTTYSDNTTDEATGTWTK